MQRLFEYGINESEKWDFLVKSFSDYDVFYLNDYVKAFKLIGYGEPILLYYENNDDRAINVIFLRDIAKDEHFQGVLPEGKYFDLSSPYGYGGFLGNVTDWKALIDTYNEYCVEKGYICEFVRFELFGEYREHYDGEVESSTHNVVRDLEMPLDEIWMDFKQKVRKNVKRAQENNLGVIIDTKGEYLADFLRIYNDTMNRANAGDFYYFPREFYRILNSMKDNYVYFHAEYEGKIVSTELVIYGAENCYSYLGGTDKDYFNVRPNDFLKFEIIKWAKEKGLKNFVLGGGYGSDDGIFQYKICLAPKGVVDFYIGRKVFDKTKYDELVALRGKIERTGYFPTYRGL